MVETSRGGKSTLTGQARDALGDTLGLIKDYAVQETVGPLRGIGRTLSYGLSGALLVLGGLCLLVLAVLRVLQSETGTFFAGAWSFAPYFLAGIVAAALLALFALLGLRRP